MRIWKKLQLLLPSRRRAEERDMQEELESLREMAEPHELGNLTLAAEDARATWTWLWFERLAQDLRYAGRSMLHDKTFTALAVLSLALGIGANTAIYSFTESILLRSLPVSDPASLVVMKWRAQNYTSAASSGMSFSTGGWYKDPQEGTIATQFPYPALEVFKRNTDVLSSAFCYYVEDRLHLTVDEATEVVRGQYVSGGYFNGMGVAPSAGRLILPDDDQPGAASVAILSHRFGQRRFGDPRQAVGRIVRINNKPFSVVGVAPPGFFGAEPGSVPDVYVPMHAQTVIESAGVVTSALAQHHLNPNYYWIEIMGRLKPGVSRAHAQAVLGPQFRSFVDATATTERQRTDLPELRIMDGSAGLDSIRRRYAKPVYVLTTMVGLILLIACANVANLLLARAMSRRREIAVRLSIGASRMRVVRQMLTESVVLSSIGGLLGLLFAWWGIRVLTLLLANGRENFTLHAELNWHVLGATLVLSALTGVLFGLAPALQATRVDVMPALKQSRTAAMAGPVRRRRVGLSQALVVAQIAFSLVLLVAAGLFAGTLSNLHAIETGFSRDDVLLFTIRARSAGYEGPALTRVYEVLRERLRQVPGVLNVSLSSRPLPAGGGTASQVTVVGAPPPPPSGPGELPREYAGLLSVGPTFFETMQIPLLAGREFDERDAAGATRVAVVNQRLVTVLGLENPVGTRIRTAGGPNTNEHEIVGVVGDALFVRLKDGQRPMVYFSYLQGSGPANSPASMTYEVRSAGNPLALASTIRQVVRQLDSRLAVSDVKTQAVHIDQEISQEITLARLCTWFAVLALIIACVGLYGTVAFNVSQRISEIGVRLALGAQRAGIVWLVLRSVLTLELVGLAIGVPAVLVGSRYLESLLFGIKPNDPVVVAAGILILLTAGLVASYVPARRASSVDPMVALRNE
jgi:predicted permease